jgi:hypothetical protein
MKRTVVPKRARMLKVYRLRGPWPYDSEVEPIRLGVREDPMIDLVFVFESDALPHDDGCKRWGETLIALSNGYAFGRVPGVFSALQGF